MAHHTRTFSFCKKGAALHVSTSASGTPQVHTAARIEVHNDVRAEEMYALLGSIHTYAGHMRASLLLHAPASRRS